MEFDAVEILIKSQQGKYKWTYSSYKLSGDREPSDGVLNANVGFYYYPRGSMTPAEALAKLRFEMVKTKSKRAQGLLTSCNELMDLNF